MGFQNDLDRDLNNVFFSDFGGEGIARLNGVRVSGYLDQAAHRTYELDIGQLVFSMPADGAPQFSRGDILSYSGDKYETVRGFREGDQIRLVVNRA